MLGVTFSQSNATPSQLENSIAHIEPLQAFLKVRSNTTSIADNDRIHNLDKIHDLLIEQIRSNASPDLTRADIRQMIIELIHADVVEPNISVSHSHQQELTGHTIDNKTSFGALEPFLHDDSITDILVNGPKKVYIERDGKLLLTALQFPDDAHVMEIATKLLNSAGRRIDDSTPFYVARLPDGSRINVIAGSCVTTGTSISIRKFAKQKITLDTMKAQNICPARLYDLLKICGAIRINIIISGGTGSGKTTLLNAISDNIDKDERIITIEDACELQLQHPHVIGLETCHHSLAGESRISERDLVKNALRMRPDRILIGEVRGAEAFDLLQAMNSGHDGSMTTLHANSPRDALARLENMICMAGINMPVRTMRTQIARAVNLIIQTRRMRDGVRRITHVTEVVGIEGDGILMQDIFTFEVKGEDKNGKLVGEFVSSRIRPRFSAQAAYFGLEQELMKAVMA